MQLAYGDYKDKPAQGNMLKIQERTYGSKFNAGQAAEQLRKQFEAMGVPHTVKQYGKMVYASRSWTRQEIIDAGEDPDSPIWKMQEELSMAPINFDDMPSAKFRFNPEGPTHSARYLHLCPECEKPSHDVDVEVLGETGGMSRTVAYRCTCGTDYTVVS